MRNKIILAKQVKNLKILKTTLLAKRAISETTRDRVKRTAIWENKGHNKCTRASTYEYFLMFYNYANFSVKKVLISKMAKVQFKFYNIYIIYTSIHLYI